MDRHQLVVVEANEVPLRIIRDLAPSGRMPFLAGLLEQGTLVETEVTEDLPRDLYPSQTWASLNTGVPWSVHGVYWYGDPKPVEHPLYWQIAARSGRSVGLVNTLHSSPLATQCADGDYRFVIPDCFAGDESTLPATYGTFQRANLSLTGANSRRVVLRPGAADLARLALSLPRLGLRPATILALGRLVAGVARGSVPRERLRFGQFLVQRDLFLRLLERHRPDLAILFTNHVASAMHRYWYALYPQDFGQQHYGDEWVARYRDEIPAALVLLDRFLGELGVWCEANNRTLVVVSSMGQGPSDRLDTGDRFEAVVADGTRFLASVGIEGGFRVLGSMNPQLTLSCDDPERASQVAAALSGVEAGPVFWDVDRTGDVVTLTYQIEVVDGETVRVGGVRRQARSIGVDVYPIDDHSSGRHIPRGILGVANSASFKPPLDDVIDHLEVAPAMVDHLGVERAPHHRSPDFSL